MNRYVVGALILVVGVIAAMVFLFYQCFPAMAFSGDVEYAELTSTGSSSATGTTFQGDALWCCWNTTGGSFTGTAYLELYHTIGDGSGEWIRTGDTMTEEGCKIIEVPENGVKLRVTATVSDGSIRTRISQEYPPEMNVTPQ